MNDSEFEKAAKWFLVPEISSTWHNLLFRQIASPNEGMINVVVFDIWRTYMKQYIQLLEIWLITIFQKYTTKKKN